MNLFTGSTEQLEDDTINIMKTLVETEDKEKQILLTRDINALANFYCSINNEDNYLFYPFLQSKYWKKNYQKYLEYLSSVKKCFKKDFIDNKKFYNELITDVILALDEVIEDMNYTKLTKNAIPDAKMYGIMSKYLETKHQKALLDEVVNGKRIFCSPYGYKEVGSIIFSIMSQQGYIYILDENNDTSKMITLIHELGHAWDCKNLLQQYNYNNLIYYSLGTIYLEVISSQYEMDFLNYLLHNNINIKDSCQILKDDYLDFIERLLYIKILANLDNKQLKSNKLKTLNTTTLVQNLFAELRLGNICYDEVDIRNITLDDEVIYGMGYLLGTYYNHLAKNDQEKYEYFQRQFLDNRYKPFSPDNFLTFVESKDALVSGVSKEVETGFKLIEQKKSLVKKK